MKKTALFFAAYIVLIALALSPLWNRLYSKFNVKGLEGSYSQLKFTSVKGDYNVFIDDEIKGTVTNSESKDFLQIEPGIRKLKFVRKSDVNDFYYIFEKNIKFLPSTEVEIELESGPTIESSSALFKYFTEISKPDGAQIYVQPFPNNAEIELDSKKVNGNIFDIYDSANHTIEVSNGNGYESKTIQVNLSNEITKKVISNIKLIVEIYLYKQPF